MAERIGELIGARGTVFRDLGAEFEALPPTLRTHGSLHETQVPMIIDNASGTLPPADRLQYNFDRTRRDLFGAAQ